MIKYFFFTACLAASMAVTGAANALTYSTKFCFQWQGNFSDTDQGEDYLLENTAYNDIVNVKARYTVVLIRKCSESGTVRYVLDREGCTPSITVSPSTYYCLTQSSFALRDGREITVLNHFDAITNGWNSTEIDDFEQSFPTPSGATTPLTLPPPPWDYDASNMKSFCIMPIYTHVLGRSDNEDYIDYPNGTMLQVRTDCDSGMIGGSESNANDHSWGRICNGNRRKKYNGAHEFGHAITWFNGTSTSGYGKIRIGDNEGSEGMFQATGVGHRCDCSQLPTPPLHCLNSREFTGFAQDEGFAHFIASAAYNYRVPPDDVGEFVYYSPVMKWSDSHGGALDWPLSGGDPYLEPGYVAELSPSTDPIWVQEECNPTGQWYAQWLSNEWDWLTFNWDLWSNGSYNFTVPEINDVWLGVNGNTSVDLCCSFDAGGDPTFCIEHTSTTIPCGTFPYTPFPHKVWVGKTWAMLMDETESQYGVGSNMAVHFANAGGDTKVNW
jgi:hypothetical protein